MTEATGSVAAQLSRIEDLKCRGLLSDETFRNAQKKILSGQKLVIDEDALKVELRVESPQPKEEAITLPRFTSAYRTAGAVSGFVSALGWTQVVVGLVSFVIALGGRESGGFETMTHIGQFVIGAVLCVGGMLQVAAAQVIRATVDTADYSREMLAVLHSRLK